MIVSIEQAEIQDAGEILQLQRLAFLSEAAIYNDYTIPPLTETLEEVESAFDRQLFLKASVGDQIIGSVRGYLEGRACFIGKLIVHPDYQNQGIGSRLMREIESRFRAAKRFEVFTGHKSERNIHVYRKLGYKAVRTEPVTENLKLVFLEKWAAAIAADCDATEL